MPADKGVRLDDRQRIANFREQPIKTNEYHSVEGAEGEFLWSTSPQNVDLLPQRPNLCLKHYPRPDQIHNHPTNEPVRIPHCTRSSSDSRSTAKQDKVCDRDRFGSPFIVRLAVIAAVSLTLFVYNELVVEKPLLRLRLLTQWNFGVGTIAAVFLGFALFGSVYLLPAYLGQVQRYNAEQIGNVLAWTGLPQLILIPLVPKLMQRFDARYIAITGLLLFAASSFMNIEMSCGGRSLV